MPFHATFAANQWRSSNESTCHPLDQSKLGKDKRGAAVISELHKHVIRNEREGSFGQRRSINKYRLDRLQ